MKSPFQSNKVNQAQLDMVNSIQDESHKLFCMELLTVRNFKEDEAEAMNAAKTQTLRYLLTGELSDEDGWVYISSIKNMLLRRKYYRDLVKSQARRDLNPINRIMIELHKDDVIDRHDIQVRANSNAEEYLNKLRGE